jgi:hypothetical protein
VRDVDGAGHVAGREQFWSAHIDQHEVQGALQRLMDVAAVGLDAQAALEMRQGGGGVGEAGFGHETGHGRLLRIGFVLPN